jgi:hypothetical protein
VLDKLKSDFDEIISLVNKAPAPLQETALRMILEQWFAANAPGHKQQQKQAEPPPPSGSIPESVKPFLTANGITTEILETVFTPIGPGVQLQASEIPGTGKAGKMVHLSLLLCVKQAIESGSFACVLKDLREMAVHYDCYDSTNFSSTLKANKSYYKPREKGADLELSGPGLKKAGELIKAIATGA